MHFGCHLSSRTGLSVPQPSSWNSVLFTSEYTLIKFAIIKSHCGRRAVRNPAPLLASLEQKTDTAHVHFSSREGPGYQLEVAAQSQQHAYRSV